MYDYCMLNDFKFKFGGSDYQTIIREEVEAVRTRFGSIFGLHKIPLMNE